MQKTLTTVALFLAATTVHAQPSPVEVNVDGGRVAGSLEADVLSWKGIPFAAPPTGANRWREPQAVQPWQGVLPATQFGHDCMQKPFPSDAAPLGTTPAEDCLVLNVWRPAKPGRKLPVVVWIYGGGFINGGSSPDIYSGRQFANKGLVFVSFNYRLGRFGFFAHPALSAANDGALGNYAYMDQIAALQWVRRNVAAFGGDPSNVTIMGESAGGISVVNLLVSPKARGLFNKAVIMSGTMTSPRPLRYSTPDLPSAEEIGVNFARSVGITDTGPAGLKALRALSGDQVIQDLNLAKLFTPSTTPEGPPTYTFSQIEDDALGLANPREIIKVGGLASVPILVGSNGQDLGFYPPKTLEDAYASFAPYQARARKAFDPGGALPAQTVIGDIAMDRFMTEPGRFIAQAAAGQGQKSFFYRFNYVATPIRGDFQSAPHASDIPFFFDTVEARYGAATTAADKAMAQMMNAYLVNFVLHGQPAAKGRVSWPPYNPKQRQVMQFTTDGHAAFGADPRRDRLDVIAAVRKP